MPLSLLSRIHFHRSFFFFIQRPFVFLIAKCQSYSSFEINHSLLFYLSKSLFEVLPVSFFPFLSLSPENADLLWKVFFALSFFLNLSFCLGSTLFTLDPRTSINVSCRFVAVCWSVKFFLHFKKFESGEILEQTRRSKNCLFVFYFGELV